MPAIYIRDDATLLAKVVYDVVFLSLLVVITFIDADLTIVPPSVTNFGIIFGLAVGMLWPHVRPDPNDVATAWEGLWVGLRGLILGGGMIWVIRVVGGFVFRQEAMGSGDIHILAMIGVFLGWQATILTIPLAAFIGLVPAITKYIRYWTKRLARQKVIQSDRELPFGPYLSMAALILLFSWPWSWNRFFKSYFTAIYEVFWFMVGLGP